MPIYTPYNPGKSSPNDEDEQLILISTKEGKKVAQLSYSIAYRISKYEADVIRVYTLDKYRQSFGEAIEKNYPN